MSKELSLTMSRTIAAPIDRVFEAWVSAKALEKWHCPVGMTVTRALSDARVGGVYSIEMKDPLGDVHIVAGTYHVLERPNKLIMSWAWLRGGAGTEETQLTVLLRSPDPNVTELTLIHDDFANETTRDGHERGWTGALGQLDSFFGGN